MQGVQRCFLLLAALVALAARTEAACMMPTLQQYPELGPLVEAIQAAGMAEALDDPSNTVTLFAPTDVAFQKLSLITNLNASTILSNANGLNLALAYHLMSGRFELSNLEHGAVLPTLLPNNTLLSSVMPEGQFAPGTYMVSLFGTPARITTANVNSPDCQSIFHIIDEFLIANATGTALGIEFA